MRNYAEYNLSQGNEYWDSYYDDPVSSAARDSNDALLDAVERAMDQDPEQDFDLLLVLERKRD